MGNGKANIILMDERRTVKLGPNFKYFNLLLFSERT